MKQIFTLIILLFSLGYAHAQTNPAMKEARGYLNKKGIEYDPSKALAIYLNESAKGNAEAMNAVGMIYNLGLTGSENETEALIWFEKAGNAGFAKGWYNAGLIYKNGPLGTAPDFNMAVDRFSKAADMGSFLGLYGMGYMHYKGLGCLQDYQKAVRYFKQAIVKGSIGSLYMLGLCYRNGYGVPVNEDSARTWLTKAALKGYKAAADELKTDEPEYNRSTTTLQSAENNRKAQEQETGTLQKLEKGFDISGLYEGYLVRYDWSGKHVLSYEPLKIRLNMSHDTITGTWSEKDLEEVSISGRISDATLVFDRSAYERKDHYSPSQPVRFEFREASLQYVTKGATTFIAGHIQQFSTERNEPEKPIYVMLEKQVKLVRYDSTQTIIEYSPKIRPYPNPFAQALQVDITLLQPAKVIIQIVSAQGAILWTKNYGQLPVGNQVLKLAPSIPSGAYFLKVNAGTSVTSHVIIKQ